VKGILQLIPIQQWFFEEMIPQRYHWNQSVLLKPFEPLQPEALQIALEHLLYHHDALRLSFTERKDQRWQAIFLAPEQVNKDLLWQISVSGVEELEVLCNEAQRSLDLERGPLLRAVLTNLPEGEQRLLLIIHHLVVDGVSWRILLKDLQTVYRQAESGQTIQLPTKTSSVQIWSERLQQYVQSEALQQELIYWQKELTQVQGNLPQDNPEGSLQHKYARSVVTHLDKTWTERLLKEAPPTYRTQINDLLLIALARVIAHWTQQSSVLIRLEGHDREDLFEDVDLTRTVGWFTSKYPVRLSPMESLDTSIKTIKEQLRAVPNKGIGFGVLRYLGDETTRQQLNQLPEARITFNYLGQFDSSFDASEGLFKPSGESSGASQSLEAPLGNWLMVNGQVYNGELNLNWIFSSEMYAETTIQSLADAYAAELRTLIEHCCRKENYAVTPSDFPLINLTQDQLDVLPIPANEIEDIYPLSPMQQGMLFHSLSAPEEGAYVNQLRVDIRGLDIERFREAWQATLDRHAVLRAGFIWEGVDEPVQVIQHQVSLSIQVHDWLEEIAGYPDRLENAVGQLVQKQLQAGFILSVAPLLRIDLVQIASDCYHMIYTHHHILMDGWSFYHLLGEVFQYYADQSFPKSAKHYRDYIEWLQKQDQSIAEPFWREHLQVIKTPTRLVHSLGHFLGVLGEIGHEDYFQTLNAQQTQRLIDFSKNCKVTMNTVVQGAWLLLLQHFTEQDTVTFGATVSGRPAELQGVEEQIGMFMNTLPVVATFDFSQSVIAWLQSLQAQNLAIREFQHTPLYDIQRWAGWAGEALFDSILVFDNYPISEMLRQRALVDFQLGNVTGSDQTNYPLAVGVDIDKKLSLRYRYARNKLSTNSIIRLSEYMGYLLAQLESCDSCTTLGALVTQASELQKHSEQFLADKRQSLIKAHYPITRRRNQRPETSDI